MEWVNCCHRISLLKSSSVESDFYQKGLGRAVGLDEASQLMTRRGLVAKSCREMETVFSDENLFYVSSEDLVMGTRIKRHFSEPDVKMRSNPAKRSSTDSPKVLPLGQGPTKSMALDWIYGCNFGNSNLLFVTKQERIVYTVSQVIVVYDRFDETQRHYLGHTNTVQCLDISDDEDLAVSGQKGKKSRVSQIRIWSLETLETYYVSFNTVKFFNFEGWMQS